MIAVLFVLGKIIKCALEKDLNSDVQQLKCVQLVLRAPTEAPAAGGGGRRTPPDQGSGVSPGG